MIRNLKTTAMVKRSESPDTLQDPALRSRWIPAAALILLVPLCFYFDHAVSLAIRSEWGARGTWARSILDSTRWLFGWWSFVVLGGVLLLHRRPVDALKGYGVTLALGLGGVHALKLVIGRARPKLGLGAYHFEPLTGLRAGFDSLPSGHAVAAGMLALLCERYFPGSIWMMGPAAVVVSLSRVAVGQHYPSDIMIGLAFAWLALAISRRWLGGRTFDAWETRTSRLPASELPGGMVQVGQ